MPDAKPRRALSPVSGPTPDDLDTTVLPRRSAEMWAFQGPAEDPVVTPRRSSGETDDQHGPARSMRLVDSVPMPARIAVPPVPAAPASRSDSASGRTSGSPGDEPVVARRSATSPTPWTDARPRRSATSPSEWEDWAESPESPPTYAEMRAAGARMIQEPTPPALQQPAALAAMTSDELEPFEDAQYAWPWRRWLIIGVCLAVAIAAGVIYFLQR